ncbi:type III secretion protein, partial [Bacillus sp. S34]|nr:type III secretion protein [Bacillus sp. S34]
AIGNAAAAGSDQLRAVQRVIANPSIGTMNGVFHDALGSIAGTLGPMLGVVLVAVTAAAVAQGGVHFRKLTPQ